MDRTSYSEKRLAELEKRLLPIDGLLADESLCIYATGSYGRLEAWEKSDIDLFFLCDGDQITRKFSDLKFIRLAAELIDVTEEMGFPEFSKDGRFLEIQYVDQMEEMLGSPEDDGENAFTARMLLLLESRPIYGSGLYKELLGRIIDFYYRDLPGHEDDFEPVFLVNDILRFWRTLTLNYEHARFEISRIDNEDEQVEARAESALKNYKLKVSRLSTCFSMVAHLASRDLPILQSDVLALSQLTPRQRFEGLFGSSKSADELLPEMLATYDTFLDRVQRPEGELLEDFRDPVRRKELMADAAKFGDEIFELLEDLAPRDRFRRLVV